MNFKKCEKATWIMVICAILMGFCAYMKVNLDLPMSFIAMARGLIGSFFVWIAMLALKKKPDFAAVRRNWGKLLIAGICLTGDWLLIFYAYDLIGTATVGLLNYTAPLIVIFLSPVLFGEKIRKSGWIFIGMAILGIILVSGAFDGDLKLGQTADASLWGIALAALSSLCYAGMTIANKKLKEIDGFSCGFSELLIEGVLAGLFFLLIERKPIETSAFSGSSIFWLLALSVLGTGIAYSGYFYSVSKMKAQSAALLSYIDPVVATVVAFTLLKEPATVSKIIGGVLLLGGIFLYERKS